MIVLVTGATSGFGQAIARRFLSESHHVIGTGRRGDRLEPLKQQYPKKFLPLAFDVGDRHATEAALINLPPEFRDVDVLVNNAGGAIGLDPGHKANVDDWEAMIRSNVNGVIYCTRLLLPGMVERKRGHVVNMGSVAGEFPYPGGNVYCGVKAFVHQFSYALRSDLLGTGVRVTDIQPGLAGGTEFSQVRFKGDEQRAAKVYEGTQPLTAEDVSDAVHWVVTRPPHVNINVVQLMPVSQAFAPLAVHRDA
jgi:3-hydroxy acid dehydrogenase/malonic semialdehyde reductase